MQPKETDIFDVRVGDSLTAWKKLDDVDVNVLECLSVLGPRNLAVVARRLQVPVSTVRFRVRRLLSNSLIFFHLSPYHTNMGLKKVIVFAQAAPGYERDLLDCLKINDFWVFLCRIYGPYEGCGGVWTIPKENTEDFQSFLKILKDTGVATNIEVIWSTCFQGVPIRSRWFNIENGIWTFSWNEWINEIEVIKDELPYTLVDPKDWPIRADYEDLLIIKELEKHGDASMVDVSKRTGIPLEKLKYHFRKHVLKHGLVEGYQLEIHRFPFPLSEMLLFKFEFHDHKTMTKFALSLLDKPLAVYIGKVLKENALFSQIYLPRSEFRNFIEALSILIKKGFLKQYHYVIQDMNQTWKVTIPYEHFEKGKWNYDNQKHHQELGKTLEKKGVLRPK